MTYMQTKSSPGFTLIEMLIVIAIISILAGIVLVGVTGFQSTARDTRRIGDLRSVQNSLELYYTRCGHYPSRVGAGGDPCDGGSSIANWDGLADALVSLNVISNADKLPVDPKDSNDQYEYADGDGGFSYVLKATLENRSSSLDERGVELDGTVFGVNCEDSSNYYCIGSS